jgi:V/A-type H+-transporting ATPase subunit C
MSGFDYGNARLHAMKSRLLSRRDLESLAELESMDALLAALTKTPYRQNIEAALARASGIACLIEALRLDLVEAFTKVHRFYSDDERELISIVLRRYDVDNLKALLRGLNRNLPAEEITPALIPVGDLSQSILNELARLPGTRAAIDALVSMRMPIAQPLLRLRATMPGAEVTDMELALEQWHFEEAKAKLQGMGNGAGNLAAALNYEADVTNLYNVLRFVHARATGHLAPAVMERKGPQLPFVARGRLPLDLLERVAAQPNLDAAVEMLRGTPYENPMRRGLLAFRQSGLLSEFEKQLRVEQLHILARLFVRDSLGIGVVLGYLALKANEVANLRRIGQGIAARENPETIRASLEHGA